MRTALATVAAGAVILIALLAHAPAAELGQPVRFTTDHPLTLGEVTIEYLGERHVAHPVSSLDSPSMTSK